MTDRHLEGWIPAGLQGAARAFPEGTRVRGKLEGLDLTGFVQEPGAMPVAVKGKLLPDRPRLTCSRCGEGVCRHGAAILERLRDEASQEAPPPVPERREAPSPILSLGRWRVPDGKGGGSTWDGGLAFFAYGGHEIAWNVREDPLDRAGPAGRILWHRDLEREKELVARLREVGLELLPGTPVFAVPEQDPGRWMRFLQSGAADLREEGWEVRRDARFAGFAVDAQGWWARLRERGDGWFDFSLGVRIDGADYDLVPVLRELLRTHSEEILTRWAELGTPFPLKLPDGRQAALPAERLRRILSTLSSVLDPAGKGPARVSRAQTLGLREIRFDGLEWRLSETVQGMWDRLGDFEGIEEAAPPAGLTVELRGYQREGLSWLQFLGSFGFGGCLADDMGLGKTVQTLSHVLLEKESGRLASPALVVCPTSLVANWRREAARFAPDLRVLVLHGPRRRESFPEIAGSDLVITTYPLLSRDQDALCGREWSLCVFDEAHQLKNPRAKAVGAARKLRSGHRIALSGTPVENHLGELWCLMDVLNPGLLGTEKRFREAYRKAIEGRGDTVRRDDLARRVAPFLLRRTKFQVASELPPKTEIVRVVAMEPEQRDLYESVRAAMDNRVREEYEKEGAERSGVVVLDALLKLRQVCCDPRLLSGRDPSDKIPSAKLELLLSMLGDMLEEGRRVLMFSQFTSMLALVEDELRARGVRHALLTGSTKDREREVDRFQGGEVDLFLISLKAGGAGLNLTRADTVVLYDPWWNPAAEAQAADRAHRIGQTNPVFVYRLIAEGTVEERIALLQERKRDLAQGILEGGSLGVSSLSPAELRALFAP